MTVEVLVENWLKEMEMELQVEHRNRFVEQERAKDRPDLKKQRE